LTSTETTDERPRILIVDDDRDLATAVRQYLSDNGYFVQHAESVAAARRLIEEGHYDLYVLDLVMPGTSGKVACREIRMASQAGIVVASSLSDDDERIGLLEMGADDYIVKPFNPAELLARIRAVLRRLSGDRTRNTHAAKFGPWQFVEGDRHLKHEDGLVVTLTGSESEVLRYFVGNPDVLCSRDDLLAVSRMRQYGGAGDRSVDVLIGRLRKKLKRHPQDPDLIETVWGRGYIFRKG